MFVPGTIAGCALVVGLSNTHAVREAGLQPLGALLGIALIVFSLFGDLPPWISWTQKLGVWLVPGIILGTVVLLAPLFTNPFVSTTPESSFYAFSPRVWAAYISIVLVSISFERSTFPARIYDICRSKFASPILVIPFYIIVVGLAGNILDGVTIIALSSVIFFKLLERDWAIHASFALLFGGLISNLITVAAEPTNIKFQDTLYPVLDRVKPAYWFSNWPICIVGIALPALALGWMMLTEKVRWRSNEASVNPEEAELITDRPVGKLELFLSSCAIGLLAAGIILNSMAQSRSRVLPGIMLQFADQGLWIFLLPAGALAVLHLIERGLAQDSGQRIRKELPIWIRLATIFSLLWFLGTAMILQPSQPNGLAAFFVLPAALRFGVMTILSLASSITDNVALAAMQGSLILNHPIPVWQIRFLFILLTWSGGFTPFGCLQSLALNSRLKLETGTWFRATFRWAILAIIGGLVGLAVILIRYPSEFGLP